MFIVYFDIDFEIRKECETYQKYIKNNFYELNYLFYYLPDKNNMGLHNTYQLSLILFNVSVTLIFFVVEMNFATF